MRGYMLLIPFRETFSTMTGSGGLTLLLLMLPSPAWHDRHGV